MNAPVMTIDGPGGAGKGTVSRAVAKQLGWHYLDSGAIYRSLAIEVQNKNISLNNEDAIIKAAQAMRLEFECADELTVLLDGIDITARLTTETTGSMASMIAALPEVRAVLLQKQRDFQQYPGLVADGRDMGTVVFPNAPYKVFLTASTRVRAKRRHKQLMEKGINANLAQVTEEIETRDRRDQQRKAAPLVQAEDAFYLDSSNLSIHQVIEEVLNLTR